MRITIAQSTFLKMACGVRGRVVQITNISPFCSLEQIRMLFGNIGVIEELVLYPPEGSDCPSKVCFVVYSLIFRFAL